MAYLKQDQVKQIIQNRPQNITPQQIIDGLISKGHQLEGYQPKNIITKKEPVIQPEVKKGILGKTADIINKGYETYKNLPVIKQATQIIGGAVGTAGALVGGAVGATLETGSQIGNVLQGKKFSGKQIMQTAQDIGESTAGFGYNIGKEGVAAAPLGGAGKAVNLAVAYSQGYQGVEDIITGVKTGDVETSLRGGIETGTALLGARGALKSKGILIDKEIATELKKLPSNIRGQAYNKFREKTITSYREILNQTPKEFQTEIKFNKNTPEFLTDQGIKLKAENNKLNNTEAIDTLKERADSIDNELENALQSRNQKFDLFILGNRAKTQIKTDPYILAKDKLDAIKSIDDYTRAEVEANGRFVNGIQLNQFKRNLWSDSFNMDRSKITNDTLFKMGHEAKNLLETAFDDYSIKELNQTLGNYSTAIRFLNKANGRTIKGGRLTGLIYKGIGAVAGAATGSHFGALVGAELAGKASDLVRNPLLKTGFRLKTLDKLKPKK